MPEDFHRGHGAARREIEADDRFCRVVVFALTLLPDALDARRGAQFQRHVRGAKDVAGHVAESAAAEVVESAPGERRIFVAVWARVGDAQPEVPVERGRDWRFRGKIRQALRPDGTVRPGMHFGHIADLAGPDHFRALPRTFVRITLVAHLGGDLVFRRCVGELPAFPDGVRQRLLHEHVLAALHGPHGGGGVHEVRYGHDHRVDVMALLIEHDAEIFVLRRFVVLGEDGLGALLIDVAKGDDVFGLAAAAYVAGCFAAGSDRGDVQFFVGRFVAKRLEGRLAAEARGRYSACQQCAIEEVSPANSISRHNEPPGFRIHYTPPTDVGSRFIAAWNRTSESSAEPFADPSRHSPARTIRSGSGRCPTCLRRLT